MIHDKKFFELSSFKKRAEDNGFTQPEFIELLAWDYELAALLQAEDASFVLKGGAGVQLYLPLEMQRVSVDIDLLCPSNADVEKTVKRVEEKLENVKITGYTPKNPVTNLPMRTFLASIPSAFKERIEVKIDVLMEDLELPVARLKNVETIALTVSEIKTLSFGAILADKLQILPDAETTNYKNFPKHVYDISALIDAPHLTEKSLHETRKALEKIIPAECKYKGTECEVNASLQTAMRALENYSRIDLRTGAGEMKRGVRNFTQVYTPARERTALWKWSCKTLKIKFFTSLACSLTEKRVNESKACKTMKQALAIERKLASTKTSETRPKLVELFTERHAGFKEIKNAPLQRLFWQIATPKNVDEIAEITNLED